MKKNFVRLCPVLVVCALLPLKLAALDLDNNFSISGGVKTGILVKNSDYTGSLGNVVHGEKYPMTLYFASEDNETYKGEGWLGLGYNTENWGVNFGFWAHGDLKNYSDLAHLGDHYLWGSLFDQRLRLIGGQGGGTPIYTGGWLNADWLSYPGLRLFWVDPLGFSIGVSFPDPDNGITAYGIKPVTYLSTIMAGAQYRQNDFFMSLMFDNNPIYDDTEANYDGGLHRPVDTDPIAQSGNIGFGLGLDNIFWGKGQLVFDGMVTSLGADDIVSTGSSIYKISPVKTILAIKAGYPIKDTVYAELKAKYQLSNGDNPDRTASIPWGRFEIEPYAYYMILSNLKFEMSLNVTAFINSYWLAAPVSTAVTDRLEAGQIGAYNNEIADYAALSIVTIKPALTFNYGGASIVFGYNGIYSRDHVENTLYLDLRWAF
ncbi:MAG: hypothetical protein FWF29_01865 [Treponema sp.]|nr:hypothetical protein [Treponema sp.]